MNHGRFDASIGFGMMTMSPLLKWLIARSRTTGPYFAIALLMPGGLLIAIFLWIVRHRHERAVMFR
jgi:hypothetical protein